MFKKSVKWPSLYLMLWTLHTSLKRPTRVSLCVVWAAWQGLGLDFPVNEKLIKREKLHKYSQEIIYQRPATWLVSWITCQWVPGGKVKRPGRETDHSPPPSTDVKNEWSYTSLCPYSFTSCTRTTSNLPCTCTRDNVNAHLLQLIPYRQPGNDLLYSTFLFPLSWAPQLSRDIPKDAGILCD